MKDYNVTVIPPQGIESAWARARGVGGRTWGVKGGMGEKKKKKKKRGKKQKKKKKNPKKKKKKKKKKKVKIVRIKSLLFPKISK